MAHPGLACGHRAAGPITCDAGAAGPASSGRGSGRGRGGGGLGSGKGEERKWKGGEGEGVRERERGRGRVGDSRERRPSPAGNWPSLAVLKCSRGLGTARRQGCRGRGGDRTAAGIPSLCTGAGPGLLSTRTAVMISLPTRPCSPPGRAGPLSLPTGAGWGWSCSMSGARLFPSLARSIVPCSQRISGLHSLVCLLILALACFKLLTCCLQRPSIIHWFTLRLSLNPSLSTQLDLRRDHQYGTESVFIQMHCLVHLVYIALTELQGILRM